MTRVSIIVSIWLVLTAGIGDAVLSGGAPRWPLLALELASSLLTVLALWIELDGEPAPPEAAGGHHYD